MSTDNREFLIVSNLPISDNDYDLFVMFLENKKQSGGGDLEKIESNDRKTFTIIYENIESKLNVLSNKDLKFKTYELRALDSSSFKEKIQKDNQNYMLNDYEIVIKNLLADNDFSIVEMYAENLLPDNEIQQITKSHFIENMFFIRYKNQVDRNVLKIRYEKKSKIRNQIVKILDSFLTNTFIIKPEDSLRTIDQTRTALSDVKFGSESNQDFSIFQLESSEKVDSVRGLFKSLNVTFDYCCNFDLLKIISNSRTKSQLQNGSAKTVSQSKANLEKPAPNQPPKKEPLILKKDNKPYKIFVQEMKGKFDDLIKFHNQIEIVLNQYEPMSIGLLNSKQLLSNLNEFLMKFDAVVDIRESDVISVQFKHFNAKNQILNALNKFHKKEFLQMSIQIPYVLQDQKLCSQFKENMNQIRKFVAVYIDIKEPLNRIELYGPVNAVIKVSKKIIPMIEKCLNEGGNGNTKERSAQKTVVVNKVNFKYCL
jgi:hypothetical protein